jgi:hypothetical protein
LKLTIIRKGDTYNITGATRKELENKLLWIIAIRNLLKLFIDKVGDNNG